MRISDWSSDVCSSDLHLVAARDHTADHRVGPRGVGAALGQAQGAGHHGVVGGGERKGGQSHFSLFPFGCREPWGKSDSDPFFFPLPAFLSNGTTSAPSSGSWPSPGRSRPRRSRSPRTSATSPKDRNTGSEESRVGKGGGS